MFAALTTAILLTGAPVAADPTMAAPAVVADRVDDLPQQPAIVTPAPAPIEQQPAPPVSPVPAPPPAGEQPRQAAPAADGAVAPVGQQDDVVVIGRDGRGDPLAGLNTQVFDIGQGADKAVFGPVALAYEKNVPAPLRSGLRNFLNNLREPVVFFNYLLQFKFGKAAETAARFVLNSTVGAAGVLDIAKRKPFRLPLRRNSFANTLGFYGVGPGPFLFLPLVGPTTLRDLFGTVVDQVLIPIQPIRPSGGLAYTVPVGILSALDYRARIEPNLQRQRATSDPYAALRRDYLERRKAEIDRLHGRGEAQSSDVLPPLPAPR